MHHAVRCIGSCFGPGARVAPATAWLLCAVTLGCTRPATQLIVVVDTDIPPSELATIRVTAHPIDAPAGHTDGEATFEVDSGARFVPFSFGVRPPGDDPGRRVEVRVEARGGGGNVVASRRVRTGFLIGQALRLPIFVADACRGRECAPELDCDRGTCVTAEVPTESLDPVTPGDELADAGGPSGGECVPVSSLGWFDLASSMQASALTSRDRATGGFEWMIAASDTTTVHVHAIGSDGTADRPRGQVAERWSTFAIWPLPPPNEALVVGAPPSPMVLRRLLVAEGGGVGSPDTFLMATSAGYRAFATLGTERVIVAIPMTAPSGIYGVPTSGPERLVTTYDLGMLTGVDRASLIPLADGGVLAGHLTADGVVLRRLAPDGTFPRSLSFSPGTPCGPRCSAPSMAELDDGRIVVATSTNGDTHEVWAWLLSADLETIIGTARIDTGDAAFVFPRADGTVWVGFVTGAGVGVRAVRADASLGPAGPYEMVSSPGADYSRTQAARRGDAIAITYSLSTPPFTVLLNVLCD